MKPTNYVELTERTPAHPSYKPGQSMETLGFPEQFVVWAVRIGWAHHSGSRDAQMLLHGAFDKLDMPEGAELIDDLISRLGATIARPLAFPCPKWRSLTGDEARLLSFLAALQSQGNMPFDECPASLDMRWPSQLWRASHRLALALSASGLYLGIGFGGSGAFPNSMPSVH